MRGLNRPSTFTWARGQNAAVDPTDYVRLQEFAAGLSGRAAASHTHSYSDVSDFADGVQTSLTTALLDSDTVSWTDTGSGLQPAVRLKVGGALSSDGDGVFCDVGSGTGQVAAGDHTHPQLHDPVTFAPSQTVDAVLVEQNLQLEVRLTPSGGLQASGDGSGVECAFGTTAGTVAAGDHTHDQLHDPLTVLNSTTLALSLADQQLSGSIIRKPLGSLSSNQGLIDADSLGAFVSLGASGTQAAPGNHTHADADELSAGFLSPALYRKLVNAADVVQVDQSIAFARHDVLTGDGTEYIGGRFRFNQTMQCLFMDLTAMAGAGSGVLGLEVDGTVVDTIIIPPGLNEVVNYKALSNVYADADAYIRVIADSGFDALDIENNPSRLHVTVGLRPAIGSAPTIRINAGGSTSETFASDGYYSGGSTSSTNQACDVTGATAPAPQDVYKTRRYSSTYFDYIATGLARGLDYKVRLHFNQWNHDGVGEALMDLTVTGATTLTVKDYDVIAVAGAKRTAAIREFTLKADVNGQIAVRFENAGGTASTAQAFVCGLEFIPQL